MTIKSVPAEREEIRLHYLTDTTKSDSDGTIGFGWNNRIRMGTRKLDELPIDKLPLMTQISMKDSKTQYKQSRMTLPTGFYAWFVLVVSVMWLSALPQNAKASDTLNAFNRSGQTFLTWPETGTTDGYHVYRHSAPITAGNLAEAKKITARWGALDSDTSVNLYGGRDLPSHFIINELAEPLSDNTGLFVYTTQPDDSQTAYYAITSVRDGRESTRSLMTTSEPLSESVSPPSDVLAVSINNGKGRSYAQFMDYSNWNPTFNGYIYNYSVALPPDYNPRKSYPLMIRPHAYTEHHAVWKETLYNFNMIVLLPNDPGPHVKAVHSWWYGYAADHNYKTDGKIPKQGVIENFTEQRVMRSVRELLWNPDFNINPTLIHAMGNSMGASGTLAWCMRYPSVLSGCYAGQPMTNYASSPKFTGNTQKIWGSKESNLPIVNRGPFSEHIRKYGVGGEQPMGVWDWMDHQKQLVERRGDPIGFIMVSHGKLDRLIDWETQGKPMANALNSAAIGFTARYRGDKGHQSLKFDAVLPRLFGYGYKTGFPWKYPLDLSFPAIQNASGSGPLSPKNTGDDGYNMNFRWATPHTAFDNTIVDEPRRYEISIKSLKGKQTADVTPRRTQQFKVAPGQVCNWSTVDRNRKKTIASGTVTVDSDALLTIPGVKITTKRGTRIVIDC